MSNYLKVKTILVSQPEPKVENSPYFELQQKHKVKIDFRSFIHVEGVSAKDVRAQKIDLNNFSAIILTSKNAVDHFFRVAEEMRYKVPEDLKYFCQSEAIAFYLQKYVVYRKRKIYVGQKDFADMTSLFKKYKDEKILLPASDQLNFDVPQTLNNLKVEGKALILLPTRNENIQKSARNIEGVKTTLVNTINVYDLLKYGKLVITLDTVKKLEEVYA